MKVQLVAEFFPKRNRRLQQKTIQKRSIAPAKPNKTTHQKSLKNVIAPAGFADNVGDAGGPGLEGGTRGGCGGGDMRMRGLRIEKAASGMLACNKP